MATYHPGRYVCKITGQGFKRSEKKDTPCFYLTFKPVCVEGANDPLEVQYERTLDMWITDKTIDKMIDTVNSLGYARGDFDGLDPEIDGFHDFAGKSIVLECSEDNGYERWDLPFNSKPKRQAKDIGLEGRMQLNAMYGRKFAEKAALRGTATKPAETTVEEFAKRF